MEYTDDGITILRTNHTGITVSDIDDLFFRDVLGFETTEIFTKRERWWRISPAFTARRKPLRDMPNHRLELLEYITKDERKAPISEP